jgi:hypothetical protein
MAVKAVWGGSKSCASIIEIILEALETLPPYRVAIGMHRKTLSENGEEKPVQKPNEL